MHWYEIRLVRTHDDWVQLHPKHWEDYGRLAVLYGWRTGPWVDRPDPRTLSAAEALGLAEALERFLADVPDHDAGTHEMIPGVGATAEQGARGHLREDPDWLSLPERYSSGEERRMVSKFAEFCRRGSFRWTMKLNYLD
jgi:hypothetical protein